LLDPLRAVAVLAKGEVGSKIVFILSLFGPGLGLALRSKWALIPSIPPLGYLMLQTVARKVGRTGTRRQHPNRLTIFYRLLK